ncbi:MAG: dicarboxylate/amino acid:cation symporter [Bdellovibrionales bacterium]|nr:dicarboxylate/amino acid:cation symporter [Bdellovibrionales bacterium]
MSRITALLRSLTGQIILGMILGALLGFALGPATAPLGEIGKVLIQAIKVFATPLLFFAILHAVVSTEVKGRHASRMLGVAILNGGIALAIGLTLSNVFRVGDHLAPLFSGAEPAATPDQKINQKIEFAKVIAGFVPTSVVQPFAENLALTVILLALLLGFALRRLKKDPEVSAVAANAESAIQLCLRATEIILTWVTKLAPVAVLGAVAFAVGKSGFESLKGLTYYVALGLGGLSLHVLITHHAWLLYLGRSIPQFWREAREPVVYSIGANSSLATLPLTLKALERLKVTKQASTLGACVGTNFNNDGILLYEAMAALMVAQAVGIDLAFADQVVVALLSMVAAMGIAGVPEAGFISLALVLSTVGLPTESLPLLLTVDWIIARGRSAVNVASDMVVSMAIDGPVRPSKRRA